MVLNRYNTDKRTRFDRKWISYITEVNKLESTIMVVKVGHLPPQDP